MKQVLFSNDMALLQRWESILNNKDTQLLDDFNELFDLKDSVVIFNSDACENKSEVLIDVLVKHNNKILILDRVPDYFKVQKWLAKGIKGYGNVIMSSSYLLSAVDAISEDLIWLIPDITTQFVKNFVGHEEPKSHENMLLDELTKKEREIALLLKEGYTNTDIAMSLNISINTVKTHVKNIYKKFQVKDRIAFSMLFK
ncbi:response regulator transcription factor [Candidatus Marinarcus aquaticus]|uniref:Helix-turn-helix transcriptional regulator n=1 Tax=Candidatus Marinarcus aquaticus TaxID=2044504 RepID=A0A4V1LNP7_9BACT|nr:response regulator transcription factor [Candidatus Marinarcus aquaticus]RXJ54596.1 helix-turn-helix transcriptional regulator [Candidatus Marinarcus aquaticus]